MPSFPLLDIAIGLSFVFLLLSLICSSINEGFESILRNRSIDLEASIRNLLDDEAGSWWRSFSPWTNSIEGKSVTSEFYRHPMIRNLFRSEQKLPTYIPARNFALAVMDMVVEDGALLRGAMQSSADPATGVPVFASTFNGVPLPARLTKSMNTLVTAASGDAQQARLNIESWFNSSMDRASGWYKSRTQKILFCIGVAITLLVNADSIAIFRNLSQSKNLQAIVSSAAAEKPTQGKDPGTQIGQIIDQLSKLDVGLGWANEPKQSLFHLLHQHAVGWLITAAAISLGAPFWFDTLNRFMVVRSTVKPREKSRDENSKD